MVASWPGTDQELRALQTAVNHHCTCKDADDACPPHKMLTDQDVLNHLAFVVRLGPALERQEWLGELRQQRA